VPSTVNTPTTNAIRAAVPSTTTDRASTTVPTSATVTPEGYQRAVPRSSRLTIALPQQWIVSNVSVADMHALIDKAAPTLSSEALAEMRAGLETVGPFNLLALDGHGRSVIVVVVEGEPEPLPLLEVALKSELNRFHGTLVTQWTRRFAGYEGEQFDVLARFGEKVVPERIVLLPLPEQTVIVTVGGLDDEAVLAAITDSIGVTPLA
jgi:hypothetical protein